MGPVAKGVVFILAVMSIWSVAVAIEKFTSYRKSRKESLEFLPIVTKCLKQDKLQEAVDSSKRYKNAHLAKVVSAGLLEFLNESPSSDHEMTVETVRRSLDRATALTTAEMKKGLGALATIGSTAAFVGLFGTVFGIITAFSGMAKTGSGGLGAVAAGIAEALVTTAAGIAVAIIAVVLFNYFQNKLERFQIEMANTSSELVDFFLKRQVSHAGR
ncbi:MAG: flagellar motor protein MotA [Acidobacteria bacterium]|nr:MAG: flagellar motor protein MotA [Acidobacteriota bacterium]